MRKECLCEMLSILHFSQTYFIYFVLFYLLMFSPFPLWSHRTFFCFSFHFLFFVCFINLFLSLSVSERICFPMFLLASFVFLYSIHILTVKHYHVIVSLRSFQTVFGNSFCGLVWTQFFFFFFKISSIKQIFWFRAMRFWFLVFK